MDSAEVKLADDGIQQSHLTNDFRRVDPWRKRLLFHQRRDDRPGKASGVSRERCGVGQWVPDCVGGVRQSATQSDDHGSRRRGCQRLRARTDDTITAATACEDAGRPRGVPGDGDCGATPIASPTVVKSLLDVCASADSERGELPQSVGRRNLEQILTGR